jgi:hypothetical protein
MHRGFTRKLGLEAVVLCSLITGCSAGNGYSGDGRMIDNGPSAATDRYVIDLGPIDLSTKGKRSFRLVNLPPENFGCGIELSAPGASRVQWEEKRFGASVSMEIAADDGEVVMHVSGPLRDWTWSMYVTGATNAFLYVQGPPGSFFDAKKGRSYRLEFSVIEPDQAHSEIKATLKLKSGGWK